MRNRVRVIVLQHPDESRHPLNTGRLAVLGLRHAELLVGEVFPQLDDIIASVPKALLLFPANEGDGASAIPVVAEEDEPPLLIVPDGTWRKVRKIIRMNPALAVLQRVDLPKGAPSEYRVRNTREPAAVSTIEAIVRALTMLEPGQDFQAVLLPFKVMVEQQIAAMGEEVYRRNYAGFLSVR